MQRNVAIFLFDYTGKAAQPWLNAGYECWIVDEQHPMKGFLSDQTTKEDGLNKVHADLRNMWLPPFDRSRIAFVAAWPPCTDVAASGARWFKGKGLYALSRSIAMFATAADFCEWSGAPYLIENPVSNISSHWRKPDYTFNPSDFTGYCKDDNYTKKTCLWTGGGFVMPKPFKAEGLSDPDDRIHKCPPSKDRQNIRSATPSGFARAIFESNSEAAQCP